MGFLCFFSFAWGLMAALPALAEHAAIIRPDPADFSQISSFQPEWCSLPQGKSGSARKICFGRTRFHSSIGVRSILLEGVDGKPALYLEKDFPGVELLKPRFGVVGPIQSSPAEFGEAVLSFDREGEVQAALISVPSFGTVQGIRGR